MFDGEFYHTLDAKGRLILPARFREELGGSFMITRGLDGCLFVYTQLEWQALDEKLQKLPLINKWARELTRFFHVGVTQCEPDKQGRILVPAGLRTYADLKKEVCMVGVGKHIEIWDKERWENNMSDISENMDGLLDGMQDMGFVI